MLLTDNYVSIIDNDLNKAFVTRTVSDLNLTPNQIYYIKVDSYAYHIRSLFCHLNSGNVKIETFTDGTESGVWTDITANTSRHFLLNESQQEATGQVRPSPNATLLKVLEGGTYNSDGRKRDVAYIKSTNESNHVEILRGKQLFSHDVSQAVTRAAKKRMFYVKVTNLSASANAQLSLTLDCTQVSLSDNGE